MASDRIIERVRVNVATKVSTGWDDANHLLRERDLYRAEWEQISEVARMMKDRLDAVRNLHGEGVGQEGFCEACTFHIPCPTLAALDGHPVIQ